MNLKANKRLKEAFSFWVKAAESYQDSDEFVLNLNACIQTLRNVTFVLQAHKAEIIEFDKWYAPWQDAMKADPIMRWCVKARNTIVKQDDLVTSSTVVASIYDNYLVETTTEVEIAITSSPELIAKLLITTVPPKVGKTGFLRVERQWKADGLDGIELLSALTHVFTVLSHLLKSVESRGNPQALYPTYEPNSQKPDQKLIQILLEEFNPEAMLEFEDYRTSWFKLPTLERHSIDETTMPISHEVFERARNRYKTKFLDFRELPTLKERVSAIGKLAQQILKMDGSHLTLVILIHKDGTPKFIITEFQDQGEKYAFWSRISKIVRRKGIREVIGISEAWTYTVEDRASHNTSTKSSIKGEALVISGTCRPDECITLNIPFLKIDGNVICGEEYWSDIPPFYFAQIISTWKSYRGFG